MNRLYKISNDRLWRIGNAENMSPDINTRVEAEGIEFWLEVMPDLKALGILSTATKSAEQVWRESAAQAWAGIETVIIDDNELEEDVRMYDWLNGALILNADRVAARDAQGRLIKCMAERKRLENELLAEDYKIIKCVEAQSSGTEMPYNILALHEERQAKRMRINAIEEDIATLQAGGFSV